VSYDYSTYALKKEVTATVTGNDHYGTHMGGEEGDWGCNHGEVGGFDVIFDPDKLKAGIRVCSYPPNIEAQNQLFAPLVVDEKLEDEIITVVKEFKIEDCKKPCLSDAEAYCKDIHKYNNKKMLNGCQIQSTLYFMHNVRQKYLDGDVMMRQRYWDVDAYGAGPNVPLGDAEMAVCSHLMDLQLCWVDYSGINACEVNLSNVDPDC
jgi:hypothetical protein